MAKAASSDATATIIGFNVRASNKVKELADRANVEIRYYSVIYNLIDDVKAVLVLTGLESRCLTLEITESAATHDTDVASHRTTQINTETTSPAPLVTSA